MANRISDEEICPEEHGDEGSRCASQEELLSRIHCGRATDRSSYHVGKALSSTSHQSRVTALRSRYPAASVPRCFLISLKKLFPWAIVPSKFSAIVCPISASVSRTPRFTPAPPPGEYAKIGTYSREWSVVGQRGSGSQPWSAVIINKSERLSSGKNSASMRSNSSSDLANPSTSFRWPYSMSKSTRVQKMSPLLRSLTATVNFSIPSMLFLVVTNSLTPRPL